MIDAKRVKAFWDSRARQYGAVAFDSIANLEMDPDALRLKVRLETEKVGAYLGSVNEKSILDLGAGVGQWAFRFIEWGASRVTAVEYSAALAEIGTKEAARRGVGNLQFVVSAAEDFASDSAYDIVFVSGLFVYLNDAQAERLARRLRGFCSERTVLLLRDGTALHGRHEINDRYSNHLKSNYSATYRTRAEYLDLLAENGFSLVKDENMFEESCPLNKYPETRLRLFLLQPAGAGAERC
jgi:cyclopropane fatty-acyl-phospholipid synthase-like methyltransferase